MLRVASTKIDWLLIAVLLVAFFIRLGVILLFPSLYHPDENFQPFEGVASRFGVAPMDWYFHRLIDRWSYALPILILLVMLRARSSMLWILVIIAILLTHSLIPHKEYRFIFPATACIVVVAAMGTADLIERLRTVSPQGAWLAAMAAGFLWIAVSLALAVTSKNSKEWYRARAVIEAEFLLAKSPKLCGILLYDVFWANTGGYAYLHRDVPFYQTRERGIEKLAMLASAFDVVLVKRSSRKDLPKDYTTVKCWRKHTRKDLCVMRRDGGCNRVPGLEPLQKTEVPTFGR